MAKWIARHNSEIVEVASRKRDLLWLLHCNHMDTRKRTVKTAMTAYGSGFVYVAPRGEIYIITKTATLED